jgi:hypothetical protein
MHAPHAFPFAFILRIFRHLTSAAMEEQSHEEGFNFESHRIDMLLSHDDLICYRMMLCSQFMCPFAHGDGLIQPKLSAFR